MDKGRRRKSLEIIEDLCSKYGTFGKVLDAGCSYGYLTNHMENVGWDIEGMDIKGDRIEEGKKKYQQANISQGDFTKLPSDKKYDIIICIGCFEYIKYDTVELIEKLGDNLQKDGIIIFSVSNFNSLRARMKSMMGKDPIELWTTRKHNFTMNTVKDFINKTSYKIVELTTLKVCRLGNAQLTMPNGLADDIVCVVKREEAV